MQKNYENPTILSEVLIWKNIKNGQMNGLDFDRQKIIGNYIVDFYCAERNTVIEIDGQSHLDKEEQDAKRDEFLALHGIKVIRIPAIDILDDLESVVRGLARYFYGEENLKE